jgi:uncharacterized membrane protein
MHDLDKALTDIQAMRSQIARGIEFRAYGPATIAATGMISIVVGLVQFYWLGASLYSFLALWTAAAALSAAIIAAEVLTRSKRVHSGLADEMIQAAVEQILPSIVAGALLTYVLVRFAPETVWMLPGLWQLILSLGIFASRRFLPAPLMAVGVWYLASGLCCLAFASGAYALSPLAMAIPFGGGQLLAAFLIYRLRVADGE